jgi:hypothetical protein
MDEGLRMARNSGHDVERSNFRLVLSARQLTNKFNGPTAQLLQDGYLTYQMVAIRRLCDRRDDVISLRRALMEAEKESRLSSRGLINSWITCSRKAITFASK